MLKNTYLNLIESKQLKTKENRDKTEFKLNYLRLYEDLKLYQIRNPILNKIDNADTLINQINEAIEPLKKHEKININQNIETIQYKEVEFIDENIKPIENIEDIKHIEFIEDIKPIENIEDIKPINDFININTDLDIIHEVKPLEIIQNELFLCCSVCKNNVKSYNTWNTLKKCFMCKECNKQGMPSGAII